jgi:hypothetical protein
VQPPLEPVAEQRRERLAAANAVEQRQSEPHAPRRKVERERRVLPAEVSQVARA